MYDIPLNIYITDDLKHMQTEEHLYEISTINILHSVEYYMRWKPLFQNGMNIGTA